MSTLTAMSPPPEGFGGGGQASQAGDAVLLGSDGMIPEDLYSSGGESNPLCMLDVEVVMNSQTPHTHITIYNRGSKDVRVRPSIYDDRMLSQDGVFTSVYFRTSETSVESGSSIDLALNNRDGVTGVLFGYLKLEDLDSSAIRTFPVIYHAVSTP